MRVDTLYTFRHDSKLLALLSKSYLLDANPTFKDLIADLMTRKGFTSGLLLDSVWNNPFSFSDRVKLVMTSCFCSMDWQYFKELKSHSQINIWTRTEAAHLGGRIGKRWKTFHLTESSTECKSFIRKLLIMNSDAIGNQNNFQWKKGIWSLIACMTQHSFSSKGIVSCWSDGKYPAKFTR